MNWTHPYGYLVRETQIIFGEGGLGKIRLQFSLAPRKIVEFLLPGAGKPKADCLNPGLNGNEWKCERLWEKYHGVVPSPPYCYDPLAAMICNTDWHNVGWNKPIKPEDVWSNRLVVVHGLRPTLQIELFA